MLLCRGHDSVPQQAFSPMASFSTALTSVAIPRRRAYQPAILDQPLWVRAEFCVSKIVEIERFSFVAAQYRPIRRVAVEYAQFTVQLEWNGAVQYWNGFAALERLWFRGVGAP